MNHCLSSWVVTDAFGAANERKTQQRDRLSNLNSRRRDRVSGCA
ncbi:hypothetical protein [Coleofasciculus sp. FACHB-SPT36]|nr:hypothetical protein [Coleofasciculus sp. FACHB-SPT36]